MSTYTKYPDVEVFVERGIVYCPATGYVFRNGKRTDYLNRNTYFLFTMQTKKYGKKQYRVNRVAMLMSHGYLPDLDVDHINGNKHDNRLVNLRFATKEQNAANRVIRRKRAKGN